MLIMCHLNIMKCKCDDFKYSYLHRYFIAYHLAVIDYVMHDASKYPLCSDRDPDLNIRITEKHFKCLLSPQRVIVFVHVLYCITFGQCQHCG